jgi:hypothetical protein
MTPYFVLFVVIPHRRKNPLLYLFLRAVSAVSLNRTLPVRFDALSLPLLAQSLLLRESILFQLHQ